MLREFVLGVKRPATTIEDPHNNLSPFFKALAELRHSLRKKVRIAYYGDSNISNDWAPYYLRNALGEDFGYGGHGYIWGGTGDPQYGHQEIRFPDRYSGMLSHNIVFQSRGFSVYGHGGGNTTGAYKGSHATFESGYSKRPNEIFSTIAVHYLCDRGTWQIVIDDGKPRGPFGGCKKRRPHHIVFHADEGRHRVRLETIRPNAVFFGLSFERKAGIVVDGLGLGAATVLDFLKIPVSNLAAGLRARSYDLVIVQLGTNSTTMPRRRRLRRLKKLIGRLRRALGQKIPILFLSPPARGFRKGKAIFPWRYVDRVAGENKEAAARAGIAFWPYLQAMGGSRSVGRMAGLYWKDLTHVKPSYHKLAIAKLHAAIMWEFSLHVLKAHPECKRRN